MVVSVLFSAFYTTFYLSSGFLIPKPQIPKWWMWSYSLTPASWTMEGLLTSQYGDIDREIQVLLEKITKADFLEEYFGFHFDRLPSVAVFLTVFPLVFCFSLCIFV
ncbi:hypothetical protein WN943_003165 [Citrus x changshan-huyou]